MNDLSLKEIKSYAIQKTIILAISLGVAVISIIIACVFILLEGMGILTTHCAIIALCVYVIALIVAIIAISYYEKVREKLIRKVDTKSLGMFFDYFKSIKEYNFVYFEIKDIFIYGLWAMRDKKEYLKQISESELREFGAEDIWDKVSKKEFLVTSLFKALTFTKGEIVYRNQYIYTNQEKFLILVNAYADIYQNKKNHTKEYLKKCYELEKKFYDDKQYAIENYPGLPQKQGIVESFVNFSNNKKLVKNLKVILIITAVIALILQQINKDFNNIVTIIYEGITILLLLIDVAQRDENKYIH